MAPREHPVASVSATTPMSPEYRRMLLRVLAEHARGELWAAHMYSSWIPRAPGPAEKLYVADIAHEEVQHWAKVIKLMEELGISHDRAQEHQRPHRVFFGLARLLVPRFTWLDVLLVSFLIDRAACFIIQDYAQSSYAPHAQVSQEILREEEGHASFGCNALGTQVQKLGIDRVERAFARWWRIALNMFGPAQTRNTDVYLRLGLWSRTNEERRQAFCRNCEPEIERLGLTMPRLRRAIYPFF